MSTIRDTVQSRELARASRPEQALAQAVSDGKLSMASVLAAVGIDPKSPVHQAALLVCQKYELDPLLKHVVVIQGKGVYITRDGYLHVAHRSGQFDGIEVVEQGEDATHYLAKVTVYRKDMGRGFTYTGRYPKNGGNKLYGPEMAIKCAEVMAMRRAFDVTGIPAKDEAWDAEDDALVAARDAEIADADVVAFDDETGELLPGAA
jgi:hypothetical protein